MFVGVSSHISQLQEYVDDTEDYINIQVLLPLLHLQDMKLNYVIWKTLVLSNVPLQYIPKFWYMEMQVFNSEGDSATLVLVSEKDINLHGVFSCSLRTTVTSSFKYVQFSWKVTMLCKIFTDPVSVEVKHFLIMQYFLYQHVLVSVIGFKLFPWYVVYMYLPYVQCAFAAGTDT